MTKSEYAEYDKAVARFLSANHVKPGCYGPKYNEEEHPGQFEPFFSWKPCECCNGQLGGNRETYSFAMFNSDGETFDADICTDCVYYLTYGKLDDATMAAMETERAL